NKNIILINKGDIDDQTKNFKGLKKNRNLNLEYSYQKYLREMSFEEIFAFICRHEQLFEVLIRFSYRSSPKGSEQKTRNLGFAAWAKYYQSNLKNRFNSELKINFRGVQELQLGIDIRSVKQ
ncbi:hypothetical protein BpHYR1_049825, partial [Brachionus plicatilis]